MQGEFKQCPNGHYYQGTTCPFCKTSGQKGINHQQSTDIYSKKTEVYPEASDTTRDPFSISGESTKVGGQSTIVSGSGATVGLGRNPIYNGTTFGDDETDMDIPGVRKESRYGRKLVGWLVTYSFDQLGVDYKLFEGRNVIGRDIDCNITIQDGRVSAKHAVLLYRAGKYSITDTQSSHGTFVNEEDIELEPRYLNDGDIIRMGNTVFKFRTSL